MHHKFMVVAIKLALEGISKGHGPFGAVIVKGNEIVGQGTNRVTLTLDPTAHAEVTAIRHACQQLKEFSLTGCTLYTTCEPCPMCLSAVWWARMNAIIYASTRHDAAAADFDDFNFYEDISKPAHERAIPMTQIARDESLEIFSTWHKHEQKIPY